MDEHPSETPRSDAPPPRAPRVPFRAAVAWGLGVVATVAIAGAAAAIGVTLTVFGLGGIVLVLVGLLTLTGATIWRRGMLPLAVIAIAVALSSTWAARSEGSLERSHGMLIVQPKHPGDIAAGTYRRGVGPVLVDLRRFNAPQGSTTRIAARADAGKLVVALPTNRCFNLDVRFRNDVLSDAAQFSLFTLRAFSGRAEPTNVSSSGLGLTIKASQADSERAGKLALAGWNGTGQDTSPYGLLAFNRWASESGRHYRAAVGEPDAPTLRLDLRASQQIVIRDYPEAVGPLVDGYGEGDQEQVGGMFWPENVRAPLAPVERRWASRSKVRTPENRARWIAWERRMIAWAREQGRRAAGPCASLADLQARGVAFLTQPERLRRAGRTTTLLGTPPYRRSKLPQRTVFAADNMLSLEADGLGHTVSRGVVNGAGNGYSPVSSGLMP
jgi:hypothetical protein